eukprot:CAMPEP_0179371198 /NCGR_PEP_ID=MMETSP0797-20121207/85595_1 /TAXON_ID=47934 /ORGANISM="Dinophysis acuminata, Strain DAEP01" /LENGTH=201 /DNA_ID=CAMNT_0021087029 /DNA_START=67 /DNA_END=670 /DNA_ORIENTATION=+
MDKYRKVEKPKDSAVKDDDEIRVTAAGNVSAYVSRAAKVFNELEKQQVVIKATGNALTKAVTLAEIVKRRFKDLHQITSLGSTEIVDEYEPLEEGLDKVTDTVDKGYQAPIDESLVQEYDPEQMSKLRGRGRGKGRGKGKSKGKGAADDGDDDDEEPAKGKGKGKGKSKGKGKGKGKAEAEISDDDDEVPAKGKGKGKKGK